jgi:hypothetical protein
MRPTPTPLEPGRPQGPPPLEWAIVTTAKVVAVAVPPSVALLLVGGIGDGARLAVVLVHLSIVVAVGLWTTQRLVRRVDERWLTSMGGWRERFATAAVAVSLVTGMAALVTLASSAALRYDPSLQFLQLLSALDIAWVTAATTIGVGWWRGRRAGMVAGLVVAVVCVWSIWAYLDAVGFAEDGGWLVDGAALWRHVLPYDIMAAVIALSSLTLGARAKSGRDA